MFRASLIVLSVIASRAALLAAEPVALLSKDRASAAGRVTEETTTIEAKDGKLTAKLGGLPVQGAASALLRDKLTRTVKSETEQRIEFHECTRDITFSFSKNAPAAAKSSPGRLTGRTLAATREAEGGWKYTLADGRPASGAKGDGKSRPAEETAVQQFAVFQIAVDSLAKLYGDEPREIGRPWRPDFSDLSKKYPVQIFIDCRLDEVAERDGDKIARITIGGLANGRHGRNRIEVRFTGTILRSLRDRLDIDVRLGGTLKYQGNLGTTDDEERDGGAKSKDPNATLEVPLTLTRNLKVRNASN